MDNIKLKLYNKIVNENYYVKVKYESYVIKKNDLHKRNKIKSYVYLFMLLFEHRVLKKKDDDVDRQLFPNIVKSAYYDGPESAILNRPTPLEFSKKFLNYDIISFDIFDTLLLRPFSSPKDLFSIVGNELELMDFYQIRVEAEVYARELNRIKKGNGEVTIYDIYDVIHRKTGIDINLGVETEIQVERDLCFANPYMKQVFSILKAQNKRIILVSDMYLPSEALTMLLNDCGYNGYEKLFVSCEHNCSKASKRLYDIVKDYAKSSSIIHVGDNYNCDIKNAKEMEIDAIYYKNVNDAGNKYRPENMSPIVGSAYSGLVNAHLYNGVSKYTEAYEFGFTVGGLYIFGFVNWINKYCKKNNIDKILFLARDGAIYQKVYNLLFDDIPNEYTYWSRMANLKCSLDHDRNAFLLQVVKHKVRDKYKTKLVDLLKSFGLDSLIPYLSSEGLSEEEFLSIQNEKMVESLLVNHWDEIIEIYSKTDSELREYYSNVIGDSKKVAIIDVGWSGNSVLSLKYLIEDKWKIDCEVSCLLAAYRAFNSRYSINELTSDKLQVYLFSNFHNTNLLKSFTKSNAMTFLFESFTQDTIPTFQGIENGKFIFDKPPVENYKKITEIHQGICDFASLFADRFIKYKYIWNISGFDAYMPFELFTRNIMLAGNLFNDFYFDIKVSANENEQNRETLSEIIKRM